METYITSTEADRQIENYSNEELIIIFDPTYLWPLKASII